MELIKTIKASELEDSLLNLRYETAETVGVFESVEVENDVGMSPGEIFKLSTGFRDENSDLMRALLNHPKNNDGDSVFIIASLEKSHNDDLLDYIDLLQLPPDTNYRELRPSIRPDAKPFERFILDGEEYSLDDGSKWDPDSKEYKTRVAASQRYNDAFLNKVEMLENIIKTYQKIISEPDGELSQYVNQGPTIRDNKGNTVQEGSGNCWLLAALLSLRETPGGRKILDKILDKNPDGSVTVNFLGSGDKYTISAEKIENGKLGGITLSSEDPDYRAVEIAMLRHGGGLEGGFMHSQVVRDLLGVQTDMVFDRNSNNREITEKMLDEYAKKVQTGEILGINASARNTRNIWSFITGKGFKPVLPHYIDLRTKHAYAVQSIDPEAQTVILRNPHNGAKKIELTYDQFLKFFNVIETAYPSMPDSKE